MLQKIKMRLDRVLYTMVALGVVPIIAGIFLVIFQDNINGVWPFLLGFGVFYYAAMRIKILNRKLSKDIKGYVFKSLLVAWCFITTGAMVVLDQNIGSPNDELLASALLFLFLIWNEARYDWTEPTNANGQQKGKRNENNK